MQWREIAPPVECLGFTGTAYQPRPLLWPKAQAKMRVLVVCLVASALTETVYLLVLVAPSTLGSMLGGHWT